MQIDRQTDRRTGRQADNIILNPSNNKEKIMEQQRAQVNKRKKIKNE